MTKDDAAVNLSLKAARCLGNLSDLHCSRDWKCAANRRFQLIKPNLLILRPFPICGVQAMCPWEAGHPGSSLPHCFLAPGRPWTPPDSYGRGWRGGKRPWCAGYLCVHLECLLEGWREGQAAKRPPGPWKGPDNVHAFSTPQPPLERNAIFEDWEQAWCHLLQVWPSQSTSSLFQPPLNTSRQQQPWQPADLREKSGQPRTAGSWPS